MKQLSALAFLVPALAIAPVLHAEVPRAHPPTLLRGATLWTATGQVLEKTDILLQNAQIQAIGPNLTAPKDARVIDAAGKIVTPGLVDMHSHLGVYAAPSAKAHQDGNEMTSPITPAVRALDAFDPEDPAIARTVAGGVTTALILPGSGNVVGGQAFYANLYGKTVADMAVPNPPRSMKWAMGENPKRIYGSKGQLPMSRMGHGWVLRRMLFEAKELRESQDRFDKETIHTGQRPYRPELEPIVALLRGQVLLQVHCYEVHDIETLIRISHEFAFPIAAIHHALEAWKIPEVLKFEGIGVATFADLWGYKMEAYDASVHGPQLLADAGVTVALKSDHPVIDSMWLINEAAKAHHYGVPEQLALQMVTRNPARLIGLGDRLGTLEVGKEADVAVWPGNPLTVGALPERVFVRGVQVVGDGGNVQAAWSGTGKPMGISQGCDE